MSCSARLPVYVLLIGAFIPSTKVFGGYLGLQGLTMFAMYSIGIVAAVFVALILKKTILRGPTPAFVMELPSYKVPGVGAVLHRVLDRGWSFVRRAGTLIFAVTIIVWAAAYYPRNSDDIDATLFKEQERLQSEIADVESHLEQFHQGGDVHQEELAELEKQAVVIENRIEGAYLENSYLGRMGQFVEPLVEPLGWDWRIGCAAIASFPAREVVVATLGVIYNLGGDEDEESDSLKTTLQQAKWEGTDRRVFNIPVALSIMVFFALCAQCASTLVVMKRETNSWRWPLFTFVYMTSLAYIAALLTYRIGMLFIA
jgi:ferrous iron transport protein B